MIVALTNSKGGVGKSTIAVHLGVWLSEQGRRVAFIDTDVLSTSSKWLTRAAPNLPIFQFQTADDLLDKLPNIAAHYEFVVADGPAGLAETTRALFSLADKTLLPCGPSPADVWGAMDAVTVLKEIQAIRQGLPACVVVPNKLQTHIRLSKELLRIIRSWNMPGEGLGFRQAYVEACCQGTVVWRLKGEGARLATAELQFLFQQLIQNDHSKQPQTDGRGRELAERHA